ncbi:hypothetical protein FN846DRAFT_887760 [Sphaerosporella brunnea]|uniref:Uncharacterized protein n=1 Tax=Sphaerosporella brunnea TaxID=1250544 RepID=A0A5J5F4W9_9PEZI|nr:hypothetical protein FN846DRAFT_887760 [Sphaerosporella brunnea]
MWQSHTTHTAPLPPSPSPESFSIISSGGVTSQQLLHTANSSSATPSTYRRRPFPTSQLGSFLQASLASTASFGIGLANSLLRVQSFIAAIPNLTTTIPHVSLSSVSKTLPEVPPRATSLQPAQTVDVFDDSKEPIGIGPSGHPEGGTNLENQVVDSDPGLWALLSAACNIEGYNERRTDLVIRKSLLAGDGYKAENKREARNGFEDFGHGPGGADKALSHPAPPYGRLNY